MEHDGETNIGIPFRMEKDAEQVDTTAVIFQQDFELVEPGMVELKLPIPSAGKVRVTLEFSAPPLPDYLPGDDE